MSYSDGLFGASDINCNGTSTSFTNSAAIGTLVIGASASTMKFLGAGTAGYILQSNAAADPTWVTSPSLTSLTLSTPLVATSGGTGISSYAIGDLLAANTTTTLSRIADVNTGNALISGGVSTLPSWGKIDLTTHITGILPVSNGGTNISSYTIGDLIYATGTTALASLADVATGNALISGGVATAPAWGKIGLTTHVSGILPIANGGTGGSAALTNGKIIVSAAGAMVEGTSSSTPTFSSATLTAGTNQLVLSSGQTITINAPSPAASRVYTIPDVLTAANFIMSEGTQIINGLKGFTSAQFWFSTDTNYAVGTASQSGTTITGVGTTWNTSMVGGVIRFADGQLTFVKSFVSTTSLTAAISQSIASQAYVLYYGYTQMDNRGNIGTVNINMSSLSPSSVVQTDSSRNLITASVNLATQSTGTLDVANGGTGNNTVGASGAIAYSTGSAYAFTTAGTSGQILSSTGGGAPTWVSASSLGVTSFAGGSTGLTPAGATTGAITLAGTLAPSNGGTGATSIGAAGSIVFSNGAIQSYTAAGSAGQFLKSVGTGTPVWGSSMIARTIMPHEFLNPNNANWKVNALAPTAVDATNNALNVRSFVAASETGVGWVVYIPTGYTTVSITLYVRNTASATTTYLFKLYYRQIPNNAAISTTWAGVNDGVLSPVISGTFPANQNFQAASNTVAFSSFSPALVAGNLYQFELTRDITDTTVTTINVSSLSFAVV